MVSISFFMKKLFIFSLSFLPIFFSHPLTTTTTTKKKNREEIPITLNAEGEDSSFLITIPKEEQKKNTDDCKEDEFICVSGENYLTPFNEDGCEVVFIDSKIIYSPR